MGYKNSSDLIVVKPETVIKWHQRGFKLYWRWKSRPSKVGRPRISKEIHDLIRQMSQENPTWGAPRIQSELKLLSFEIADSTAAKYMIRQKKPLSQTWRTFLKNHVIQIAAIDLFTVPTVNGYFAFLLHVSFFHVAQLLETIHSVIASAGA